ncbi:MAG: hypothetical protein GF307_00610 [candidate division Zixibacteria bacterium]|nr:hypothetical protein [candidate division Zixibacteria bacterium]
MAVDTKKIGQLIVAGFDGNTPPDYILELIENDNLGGIILFTRNGRSPSDFRNLIINLSPNSQLRPLVFIDQEGGRVNRINFGRQMPSAWELASWSDDERFDQENYLTAHELKDIGVHVNTVPVVDIPSRDDVPVLEGRCYGRTPEAVIRYSGRVINIYNEIGVLSCAKHYPGLGDVAIDPHLDLPVDTTDMPRLTSFKLLPFIEAIRNGVPIIMTTHVILEALDRQPVTFSKKAVHEILVGRCNFKGMIVTDDLEMGAVSKHFKWEETIINALNAGHHQLLICHEKDKQLNAMDIIAREVEENDNFAKTVEIAIEKVIEFKQRYFSRIGHIAT